MRAVQGRVQGCFQRHGMRGVAKVRVTIAPSGQVTSARVQGAFTNTPSGACVEAAVRTARFPSSGAPMRINYPFVLR